MKKDKELNFKQTCILFCMVLGAIFCLSDIDITEVSFRLVAGLALIVSATIYTLIFTEFK